MNSDTPRTDAEIEDARNVALEFNCKNPPPVEGENIYVVRIDFACQLERENNQLRAELDLTRPCVNALRTCAKYCKANTVGAVADIEKSLAAYDQFKSRKGGEAK